MRIRKSARDVSWAVFSFVKKIFRIVRGSKPRPIVSAVPRNINQHGGIARFQTNESYLSFFCRDGNAVPSKKRIPANSVTPNPLY